MSDFSLTLVLQIKTSKIINDMTKVQQKSEKITAFGGIFFVLEDHGVGSSDHFSALKIWMFENKFVSLPSHLKTIEPMARPIRKKAVRVFTT